MKKILQTTFALMLGISVMLLFAGCGSGASESVTKAKEMNADEFKASCETIDYKELTKNPDANVDKSVKAEVRIEQDFDDGYYRAYAGNPSDESDNWYEYEYIIHDVSDDGLGLATDDAITAYGVYSGLTEVERALDSSTDDIPQIDVILSGDLQSDAAIKEMVDKLKLKKSKDEFGDVSFTGSIQNTTGIKFDSFSIEITCMDSNGSNVGSDAWYIENWKPDQKATVKFEYLPEGTDSIEITGTSRYSN